MQQNSQNRSKPLKSLTGKTALVCGASQGIGQATAVSLAQKGAKVILLARSEDKLKHTLSLLDSKTEHSYVVADLADREGLEEKIKAILKKTEIQILICNTGGPKGGPLVQASDEEFMTGFSNHVLANSRLTKLLLPGMKAASYGRIINIISTSVKAPIPNLGVSNVIRGAVASWAKTLATELGAEGITVNNVLPGYTDTPRLNALIQGAASKQNVSEEKIIADWKNKVPAKRFAKPEEIASAVAFLSSPEAGYINGINLPVDGGRTPTL
jgi:3-oxoacyl-[acyl-carrier protein] reductase